MLSRFSKNIAPYVKVELASASQARLHGETIVEFQHLENAHVLGQESTYWHVKVHMKMLAWALRNKKGKEIFGQIFRIVGATTKTAIGLVPEGNTGGANVSPFKSMPIQPDHARTIDKAKKAA